MKTILAMAFVMAIISTVPAKADSFKTIFHDGDWSVLLGVPHGNNPAMCVMVDHSSSGNRFIAIKYAAGSKILIGQLYKSTWNIPNWIPVPIILNFSGRNAFKIAGHGSGNSVFWRVNNQNFKSFLYDFSVASKMSVIFEAGNEQPWLVGLIGSNAASDVMARCITDVDKALDPSQPYSGSGQANEQPFTPPAKPNPPTSHSATPTDKISPPGPDLHV